MNRPKHTTPSSTAMTLVAPGTRVDGTITGDTEVRVDGELVGEIRVTGRVSIGRDGKVDGSISAQVVQVAGSMQGDIQAAERIAVEASGVAHGNLSAPRVVIAEGAFFKGRVEMGRQSTGSQPSEAPKPAAAQAAAKEAP